jgi:hypothetical protein
MLPVGFNFFQETTGVQQPNDEDVLISRMVLFFLGCIFFVILKKHNSQKDLQSHVIEWMETQDLNSITDKVHVASGILNAKKGANGLKISCANLTSFPTLTPELKTLTVLEISNTRLTAVPKGIEHLRYLKKLFLDRNRIIKLSERIFLLQNLEVLSVCQNSLQKLPDFFNLLKDLRLFCAAKNFLKVLPPSLSALDSLKILFLSENQLDEASLDFTGFESLETVDLSGNALKEIPKNLLKDSLKALNLATNQIDRIPDEIENAFNLRVLRLSENLLVEISKKIGLLEHLESLDLCLNLLRRLPPEMGNLASLRKLNLVANIFLTELPLSFSRLSSLERLDYEFTPIPQEQIDLIYSRINGSFEAETEARFLKTFSVWARLAGVSELKPPSDLSLREKESIVNWMMRLESTIDFSCQTSEVTRLCIEMIQFLEDTNFKREFFLQLEDNLTGCEDRSLLNLVLLNLIFQRYHLQGRPMMEQYKLLYSSAKTLEMLRIIPEKLFLGQVQAEDTELYLFVLQKFQSSLELLLPFPIRMHYPDFAEKLMKKRVDWESFECEIQSKDPTDLIFSHLPEVAFSFLKTQLPDRVLEIETNSQTKLEELESSVGEKGSKVFLDEINILLKEREELIKSAFKEIC